MSSEAFRERYWWLRPSILAELDEVSKLRPTDEVRAFIEREEAKRKMPPPPTAETGGDEDGG